MSYGMFIVFGLFITGLSTFLLTLIREWDNGRDDIPASALWKVFKVAGPISFLISFGITSCSDRQDAERAADYQASVRQHEDAVRSYQDKDCKRSYLPQRYGTQEVWTCPDGNQYLN